MSCCPEKRSLMTLPKKPCRVKAAYSVFLTNKRALFRFDGLGSSLTQSFFYHEIQEAATSKRLFFTYLDIKTERKTFLFHVADAPTGQRKYLKSKINTVFR